MSRYCQLDVTGEAQAGGSLCGSDDPLSSGMTSKHDRPALLVIDVQEGSFTIPGAKIDGTTEFLSRVSDLISSARRDGVPVVYSQFCGPSDTPMARGQPGNEIHSAVAPRDCDIVVQKDDSDAFVRSELQAALDRLGVRTLIICGMQSEFCVDATCRSAYGLGYDVVLVADAHATSDSPSLPAKQIVDHHNATLARAYVTLSHSVDVFE